MKETKASQNNNSCDSDVFYNHIELKNSQINDLVNRMMQISFDILIISLTILLNLYAVPKVIWRWGFLQNAWYFIFFCHLYCF